MQLLVDRQDLTAVAQGLTWSNTDPGGYENLAFSLPTDQPFYRGTQVWLLDGPQVIWMGRISEVTVDSKGNDATTSVSCQGYVAALKDITYSMIYVDRDLSHWQGMGIQRRLNLNGSAFGTQSDGAVTPDITAPSLAESFQGAWAAGESPISESWYDAGTGTSIASVYYAWKKNANVDSANVNWNWQAHLSTDDVETTIDSSGNLRAAGPGSGTITATGTRRFAVVQHFFSGVGGTEGSTYEIDWTTLAVFGPSGLQKRGTADFTNAQGFWPSDIVGHALKLSKSVVRPGIIPDSNQYTLLHSEYRTGATPWQVITDMVGLMGWHAGVWEPLSILDSNPRLDFRPPPTTATAIVARRECGDMSVTQRLDDLYDTAVVSYTDAAGAPLTVTVTVPFEPLNEAGLSPRVLPLDLGLSSAAGATTFGRFALELSQAQARGAGSTVLPASVKLASGGAMPAYWLKAGLDRLRVVDIPNAGPVTEDDTRRRDVFRISRVECSAGTDGTINTTVELDVGASLIEVLQARLAVENILIGAG